MNQIYLSEAIEKLQLNEAWSDSFPGWLKKQLKGGARFVPRKDQYSYTQSKIARRLDNRTNPDYTGNLFELMTKIGYDLSQARFVSVPKPQSLSDAIFSDPDKLPVMHIVTPQDDQVYIPGVNDSSTFIMNGRNVKFSNLNNRNFQEFVPEDGFGYIDLSDESSHIPQHKIDRPANNVIQYSGETDDAKVIRDAYKNNDGQIEYYQSGRWYKNDLDKNSRLSKKQMDYLKKIADDNIRIRVKDALSRGRYYDSNRGYVYFDINNPSEVRKMRDFITMELSDEIGFSRFDKSGYWRGQSDLNKVASKLQASLDEIQVKKLPRKLEELGEKLLSLKDALVEKQAILMQNASGMGEISEVFTIFSGDIRNYKSIVDSYFNCKDKIEQGSSDPHLLDSMNAHIMAFEENLDGYKTRSFVW